MKFFFGLITLIVGVVVFGAGCEKGNAIFIIIGIILGITGVKVIKS